MLQRQFPMNRKLAKGICLPVKANGDFVFLILLHGITHATTGSTSGTIMGTTIPIDRQTNCLLVMWWLLLRMTYYVSTVVL